MASIATPIHDFLLRRGVTDKTFDLSQVSSGEGLTHTALDCGVALWLHAGPTVELRGLQLANLTDDEFHLA